MKEGLSAPSSPQSAFRYYGFFGLHATLIIAWYLSPWYLSPWFVLLSVAVYYVQNWLFGGCLLSFAQFERRDRGFYAHYLAKFGIRPGPSAIRLLGHIIPISLILIAFLR